MTRAMLLDHSPDGYVNVAPQGEESATRSRLASVALASHGREATLISSMVLRLGRSDAYALSGDDARHINRVLDFPDQPDWDWTGVLEEDE